MGLLLSKLSDLLGSFSQTESARICMLGLDAAGKSIIINDLLVYNVIQN